MLEVQALLKGATVSLNRASLRAEGGTSFDTGRAECVARVQPSRAKNFTLNEIGHPTRTMCASLLAQATGSASLHIVHVDEALHAHASVFTPSANCGRLASML